jgi:hypothetical protein
MKERAHKNSRNSNEQATPYLTKKRSNPRSDRYQLQSTGPRDKQPRGSGGRRTGGSRIRRPHPRTVGILTNRLRHTYLRNVVRNKIHSRIDINCTRRDPGMSSPEAAAVEVQADRGSGRNREKGLAADRGRRRYGIGESGLQEAFGPVLMP